MTLLFSQSGIRRLDQIVQHGMLCAFDFDGTLAPIVSQPDQARLPEGIRERLQLLAKHATVAIITGRAIADIQPRLGFSPHYLVGNHGLEGVPGGDQDSARYANQCSAWKHALGPMLAADEWRGVEIEDKRYSLSLHFRHVARPAEIARRLQDIFARLPCAPHVIGGKYVFNLMPQGAANKGIALEKLMRMCDAPTAIYAGDDVTDEDVFRLRRADVLGVRVEHAEETAAEFHLPHLDDMAWLLDELNRRLNEMQAVHGERRVAGTHGI